MLCKTLEKTHCVLDLRQAKLARVDAGFAKAIRRAKKIDSKPKNTSESKKSGGKAKDSKKRRKKKKGQGKAEEIGHHMLAHANLEPAKGEEEKGAE